MNRAKLSALLLTIALTGCGQKPPLVTAPAMSAVSAAEQVQLNAALPAVAHANNESNLKEMINSAATTASDAAQASTAYDLKQHVTYTGPRSSKKVALTFDDGPDAKYTQQILAILKKENVTATFFVIGEHASAHPEVMKQIASNGHEIGNHSWDHTNLSTLNSQQITDEINKTDEVLQRLLGHPATLVRPPYGALSKEFVDIAEKSHQIVCWSVDTRDWEGISAEKIIENVKKEVKPGAIILQHSAGGKKGNLTNTVTALPHLIQYLREHGYEFTTVSELIHQGQG